VKKCSGFPYALDVVDRFLRGVDIKYVVTTSHPAAVYRSSDAIDDIDVIPVGDEPYLFPDYSPEWWARAPGYLRTLYYWHDL